MSVRVDGLTEARATFDALPQAFRDVTAEVIQEGADIIFNEAYRRVPVGSGRDPHPGELRNSLGENVRADGLQAAIGSGLYRAKFTEFGTNDTPAEPFLFPAFRIGATYVRRLVRELADEAGVRARFRTKRGRK